MRRTLTTGLSICAMVALSLSTLTHAAAGGAAAFVDAAMNGNRDAVRALLKDGADVNTTQADGMTALHWAAQKGDVELAKVLLYASANLKATTRIGGYTPLLIASKNGDAAMIETLTQAGADANAPTTNGTTPLMLASAAGKPAAVKALLDHGANVNAKEAVKGETALTFAAAFGRADVIRVLTAHGADVKATTKAVDLADFAQGRAGAARGGARRQQRRPGRPRQRAGRPRRRAAGTAGRRRQPPVQLHRAGRLLGRPRADAPGRAPGRARVGQGAARGRRRRQPARRRRSGHPAADRDDERPLRSREVPARQRRRSEPGAEQRRAPLYAALNCQWAAKALYPQPRAYEQQHASYLDLMKALLDKGADPNARLTRKVWYAQYDFDQSGVDETGATPFWRAAYAADVDAMKLMLKYGADPEHPHDADGRPRPHRRRDP